MSRQCLFCNRSANSLEHIWPAWILERLRIERPIRHSIGNSQTKIINNPQLKVRAVCEKCNNGWMSVLESQNIPLIGCLMQDISAPLDASQQGLLAAWSLKTAIVLDSVGTRNREFFYYKSECENLRLRSTIPGPTRVWVGRCSASSLALLGTDVWIDLPQASKVAKGTVATIVVGHLAVQVLVIHVLPEYKSSDKTILAVAPKPGPWDASLLAIWPVEAQRVMWPPPVSFTATNRSKISIARLRDRWRIGKPSNTTS
jgi:hypothetical protein